MKKALFLLLFLSVWLLLILPASLAEEIERDWFYTVMGETVTITRYIGNDTEVTVPGELRGKKVTKVNEDAFDNRTKLTEISFPASVTDITLRHFSKCEKLKEIKVSPDHPVFATIDGVLFNKQEKKLICFPRMYEKESYEIPSGILSIGEQAFGECENLKDLTIPDTVTEIGKVAFYRGSLSRVTIPDSVTSVAGNPFAGCRRLDEIQISAENPYLSVVDGVLISKQDERLICYPRVSFSGPYEIPDGIKSIGDYAFYECQYLKGVTIPDSVTSNGEYAFSRCRTLNNVEIPDSVTSIGVGAFRWCESLRAITIPDGITTIEKDMFNYCKSLADILIPDSVTSIGDWAFSFCSSLTDVVIPESVTNIGESAFASCSSLVNIIIPESVANIGQRAFSECIALKGIKLPEKLTSIEEGLFVWCWDLTDITIPESVTSIGNKAFSGCKSLTGITIPKSVAKIGEEVFKDCKALETVTVAHDSYAKKYCENHGIEYTYADADDWLNH